MKRYALLPICSVLVVTSCEVVPHKTVQSGQDVVVQQGRSVEVVSGRVDSPPYFLSGRAPIFSAKLIIEGVRSGETLMHYTVTADGKATSPRVVTATHPQFAAGVAYVMPTWKFKPAMRDGQPVAVVVEELFRFGEDINEFRLKK